MANYVNGAAAVPSVLPQLGEIIHPAHSSPHPTSPQNNSAQDEPIDRPFPEDEVHELARSFSNHLERSRTLERTRTRRSSTAANNAHAQINEEEDLGPDVNPFTASGGPIDPSSPDFNARAWAKAMIKLHSSDNERAPGRTAGVSFRDLGAYGRGADADFQRTLLNSFTGFYEAARDKLLGRKLSRVDILQGFDGLVRSGEMLVVLGPPGSGCTTFLKTISGETDGFKLTPESYLNYQGISAQNMHSQFRGEAIYTAEVDVHFPQMSVFETLFFAANARAPRRAPGGVSRKVYAEHMAKMMMAAYGISHTYNTKVGNDFIRGVSGGERKRVTIAEASLSQSPLQCWDNSTRGLDSANAVEFCKTLRMSSELTGTTSMVAIYQAPQSAYDLFDKVTVLYKGRQIYFGKTTTAKQYFLDMGFECPERQTIADFLTSITSEKERIPKQGWEDRVPRTPDEFVTYWKSSAEYKALRAEIDAFEEEFPIGGPQYEAFKASRKAQQAKGQRVTSPYTLTYMQQIQLCLWRGWKRLIGNPEITLTQLFGNQIMALIISSVFYNLQQTTDSFRQRGSLLFFAILLAGFASALEILTLFAQRSIVEKHTRYAFYHPSAEAFASMAVDMPYKITNSILFSITLYFMTNLRREPGPFFFFLLISFSLTMTMSMVFRTIGASARSLSQALAPSAVLMLALVIFTGFVIPTRNMLGWSRWIGYIDPISYGFEALMVNEFSGQEYSCSAFVPAYPDATGLQRVCSTVGAQPGSSVVNGDAYINASFEYYAAHRWRNFGIILAFAFFFLVTYLVASEYISEKKSKGEILVFQRGHSLKGLLGKKHSGDVESGGPQMVQEKNIEKPTASRHDSDSAAGTVTDDAVMIPKQTAIFQWEDVCYDIKIKKEERRILDHVDGWVKPGTLTALMGVSGAGKTTLLDVLATRVTMGVVTGKMLVDGSQRDDSFQRKTGYVQQQDLHLSTSTVREALNFSAILRQPRSVPKEEKLAYVDEVIKLLDMEPYADAVVGVPGTGLNVEQRKRLTIGVELAAKPELLLFLDEPTSGLDSQTSWSILELLEKLKRHGQAILCTIHQPSAMLFQRFDSLLFLAKGGRTVYYGEVGEGSHVLTSYFERNGAHKCPENANPAEWMLEVIGAAPGTSTDIDWHQTWLESPERKAVKDELRRLEGRKSENTPDSSAANSNDKDSHREFAAPFKTQLWEVLKRVGQQYYRTPSYLWSKLALVILASAFIGFVFFRASKSLQSLQNQMFSIFMLLVVFPSLCQQIMPLFVTQRDLYEARERPAKTYSWQAFMLSNIMIEIPWQSLAGLFLFVLWYYPIGLYRNAEPTNTVHERGALTFILMQEFMWFTSTFAHMIVAGIPSAETAGNIASLLFSLCLIFCGVLATSNTLGWWIFMNRVSPFTYIVEGLLTTAIAGTNVVCEQVELLNFEPPSGQTCEAYMAPYIQAAGGYLAEPAATSGCQFCPIASTDVFISSVQYSYGNRWRDVGLIFVYIFANVVGALGIYWLARVPKKAKKEKE